MILHVTSWYSPIPQHYSLIQNWSIYLFIKSDHIRDIFLKISKWLLGPVRHSHIGLERSYAFSMKAFLPVWNFRYERRCERRYVPRKNVFMNIYSLKEGRGGRAGGKRGQMHFVCVFEGMTDSSKEDMTTSCRFLLLVQNSLPKFHKY